MHLKTATAISLALNIGLAALVVLWTPTPAPSPDGGARGISEQQLHELGARMMEIPDSPLAPLRDADRDASQTTPEDYLRIFTKPSLAVPRELASWLLSDNVITTGNHRQLSEWFIAALELTPRQVVEIEGVISGLVEQIQSVELKNLEWIEHSDVSGPGLLVRRPEDEMARLVGAAQRQFGEIVGDYRGGILSNALARDHTLRLTGGPYLVTILPSSLSPNMLLFNIEQVGVPQRPGGLDPYAASVSVDSPDEFLAGRYGHLFDKILEVASPTPKSQGSD